MKISKKVSTMYQSFKENIFLRWATLVVLASALAYIIAGFTTLTSPTIAALTAALMVQGTFHESVKESLLQVVGVTLGAFLGVALVTALGSLSVVALIIATSVGFFFASVAKMAIHSAVGMTVPIIVIVGGQFLSAYSLEQRIFSVLIGVFVALAASYLTKTGKPTERIVVDLKDVNYKISTVLSEVATSLDEGKISKSKVEKWEAINTECLIKVFNLREESQETIQGSKYTPFVKKEQAEKVLAETDKMLTTVMASVNTVESYKEAHKYELKVSDKKKKLHKAKNHTQNSTTAKLPFKSHKNQNGTVIERHSPPDLVNAATSDVDNIQLSSPASETSSHVSDNLDTSPMNVSVKEPGTLRGKRFKHDTVAVAETDVDIVEVETPISPAIPTYIRKTAEIITVQNPQLNSSGELIPTGAEEDELVKVVMETQNAVKDLVKESEQTKELVLGSSLISNLNQISVRTKSEEGEVDG